MDGKLYCKACTTYTSITGTSSSLDQGSTYRRTTRLYKHWSLNQHGPAAQLHTEVEAANHSNSVTFQYIRQPNGDCSHF